MAKISTLKRSIHVAELSALSSALLRAFGSSRIERASVKAIMAEIQNYNGILSSATLKSKSSVSTAGSDKERDKKISAMNKILTGYCAMKNAEMNAPAQKLKAELDVYLKNKIASKSLDEETEMVLSLLGVFSGEKMQEYVKILPGVQDAIDDLREANEACIASRDAKSAAKKNKVQSASEVKEPLVKLINEKLVPILNAALIEESEDILDFAKTVSVEIASANSRIDARTKAAKKSKADTTAETQA